MTEKQEKEGKRMVANIRFQGKNGRSDEQLRELIINFAFYIAACLDGIEDKVEVV